MIGNREKKDVWKKKHETQKVVPCALCFFDCAAPLSGSRPVSVLFRYCFLEAARKGSFLLTNLPGVLIIKKKQTVLPKFIPAPGLPALPEFYKGG